MSYINDNQFQRDQFHWKGGDYTKDEDMIIFSLSGQKGFTHPIVEQQDATPKFQATSIVKSSCLLLITSSTGSGIEPWAWITLALSSHTSVGTSANRDFQTRLVNTAQIYYLIGKKNLAIIFILPSWLYKWLNQNSKDLILHQRQKKITWNVELAF